LDNNEIVSGLILELRRGTLVLSVLSQLTKPMYGYSLVKKLNDCEIPIEANTLYPLMRRLESQGILQSEWETSGTKPRKYYVLTDEGRVVLERVKEYWYMISHNLNYLLEGKEDE